MLNTPPDSEGSPGSPGIGPSEDAQRNLETLSGQGLERLKVGRELEEHWRVGVHESSRLAVVEKTLQQVVEVKRLEASTAVELERLKQTGATERTRLTEEGRTQRSACVAAMAKRAMEEYHQTERQKIESTAQVQQAEIAARVAEAEAQAKTPPRPFSHWLLLWLVLGQTRRPRKVGLPMARIAAFLLVLRGIWSSGFHGAPLALLQRAWRTVIASLQQRPLQLQPAQPAKRDVPMPQLRDCQSSMNACIEIQ